LKSGSNNFNDFAKIQLTKFCAVFKVGKNQTTNCPV